MESHRAAFSLAASPFAFIRENEKTGVDMLWLGSWIVLIGFWCYALRLGVFDNRWLSLVFVSLWAIAKFGFPLLGIEGPIYFISFAAILTVIMIFIDLYRSNIGRRNPPKSPLNEIPSAEQEPKN